MYVHVIVCARKHHNMNTHLFKDVQVKVVLLVTVKMRARANTVTRPITTTSCNKRSRHGGTFPTQGDAILRNVKPVIPSVLVSLPRYIIKCSGGKDGLCWGR